MQITFCKRDFSYKKYTVNNWSDPNMGFVDDAFIAPFMIFSINLSAYKNLSVLELRFF